MKRLLHFGMMTLAGAASAAAAVVPVFISDSPLYLPAAGLPTINATVFINQSTFSVSPYTFNFGVGTVSFSASTAAGLPYETFNTLHYTNEIAGVMDGSPGFRFMTTRGRTRVPAASFFNEGYITAASYLEVRASNIFSPGFLASSSFGLVKLVGKGVDVSRTGLRTGEQPNITYFGGENDFGNRPIYDNAPGVVDAYWGVGTNGTFLGTGRATPVGLLGFNLPDPLFGSPSPSTPSHEVQAYSFRQIVTNRASLPKFNSLTFPTNDFAAWAYTNVLGGTSTMIQVVIVRTNSLEGNLGVDVRFAQDFLDLTPDPLGPFQAIVQLRSWDYDIALETFNTNTFYLTDSTAVRTNLTLFRERLARPVTRRPNVYELTRSEPSGWFGSVPANTAYTNGMLDMTTGYVSNRVNVGYAAYSGRINSPGITNSFGFASVTTANPTNLPGRVDVSGDKLNLELTRIRAESTIMVHTKDLTANNLARTDAPLMSFDLTSTQPELIISNLAPATVRRLSGAVCAWSGVWRNFRIDPVTMTTNEINFHVLYVDHSLQAVVPVDVFKFAAHATNLVLNDPLIVSRSLLLDAKSLDVRDTLSFPANSSWARTNVLQVVNLTNSGYINVSGGARYGTDRPAPYNNFVNTGTNLAAAQNVRSMNFSILESGCLGSFGGPINIDAINARVEGNPLTFLTNIQTFTFFDTNGLPVDVMFTNFINTSVGPKIQGNGDLQIKARDLIVSNSVFEAGFRYTNGSVTLGRLVLSVTNRLVDAGPEAVNYWSCTAGFDARRRPATSSLLGTWVSSSVSQNQLANHFWPAQDRGATADGFTNNMALGRLTLNMNLNNARAVFRSAGGRTALYVDYVEFFHGATNFNRVLSVDPNLTIYFANANVPVEKLDGAVSGRFRWVSSFAGPLSTTNIMYPSGNIYSFNIALISNLDIDSDNDGVPNGVDPYPIDVPGEIIPPVAPRFLPAAAGFVAPPRLSISVVNTTVPAQAVLSWDAPAYTGTALEFKNSILESNWRVLTNFPGGTVTAPVRVYDSITGPDRTRFYRLQVNPSSTR